MKQNNSAELSVVYSFHDIHHKNDPTMTKRCLNQNFPMIVIVCFRDFLMGIGLFSNDVLEEVCGDPGQSGGSASGGQNCGLNMLSVVKIKRSKKRKK